MRNVLIIFLIVLLFYLIYLITIGQFCRCLDCKCPNNCPNPMRSYFV